MKFSYSSPLFLFDGSRHIDRIDFYCQSVRFAYSGELCYIHIILNKHAGNITQQMTVYPDFRPIIDPVQL